jgi:hypothetical protein
MNVIRPTPGVTQLKFELEAVRKQEAYATRRYAYTEVFRREAPAYMLAKVRARLLALLAARWRSAPPD